MGETIYSNNKAIPQNLRLSIASPFYGDDPSRFVKKIINSPYAKDTQLIMVDDGSKRDEITQNVKQAIDIWPGPAQLITFHQNQGRAAARNRAINSAQGEYILFLDSDVVPLKEDFLDLYFNVINNDLADVAHGGSLPGDNIPKNYKLHYNISITSDCLPAQEREKRGAYTVASNNLLVKRDVFLKHPFNAKFAGWGWEDTEWAMRIQANHYRILHIDNPVVHIGLDDDENLVRKYREAGENMALMVQSMPEVKAFAAYKMAKIIEKIPFHKALRPIAKAAAIDKVGILPMFIRRMALKYWRASWAAEALHNAEHNAKAAA